MKRYFFVFAGLLIGSVMTHITKAAEFVIPEATEGAQIAPSPGFIYYERWFVFLICGVVAATSLVMLAVNAKNYYSPAPGANLEKSRKKIVDSFVGLGAVVLALVVLWIFFPGLLDIQALFEN